MSVAQYTDHIGLWEKELKSWLPERIFDGHVHLSPPGIMRPISEARRREPLLTFTSYTWEQLREIYRLAFSGKQVVGVIGFPFPPHEVDIDAANDYIIELMSVDPSFRGFALADPVDADRTIRKAAEAQKRGVRFSGVKPYFDLLGKSNYVTTMPEFIPERLLEFMSSESLVMMLHTSSTGMGDPEDQAYVRQLCERYPRIKVVLAHLGRYLQVEQFLAFMETDILDYPSVFLEMSSATRIEAYERVLEEEKHWSKLIFGTDFPFGLITGVEHWTPETGPIFISRDRYAWSDPSIHGRFSHLEEKLTYNTYHVIEAFKAATEKLGIDGARLDQLKAQVFRENGLGLGK